MEETQLLSSLNTSYFLLLFRNGLITGLPRRFTSQSDDFSSSSSRATKWRGDPVYRFKRNLFLKSFCIFLLLSTVLNAKPDLEKAYKEGLVFAESKLKDNNVIFKPRIGVCQKTTEEHDILKCLKGGKGHELKLKEDVKEDHKNEEQGVQKNDKIYVFISFSMPKESIESLLKEATKHNAVLVLRGLKNNSFKETAKIIKDFYDKENAESAGFEINPELFEQHAINHVPVFLNTTNQNRLSGNVTLSFAVQKLKEEAVS